MSRIGVALLLLRWIGQLSTNSSIILKDDRNDENAAKPPHGVMVLAVRSICIWPPCVSNLMSIAFHPFSDLGYYVIFTYNLLNIYLSRTHSLFLLRFLGLYITGGIGGSNLEMWE